MRELLAGLHGRVRAEFLDRRTVRKGGRRQLKVDGIKALAAGVDERERVTGFMERFAADQANPGFFQVLDVACRIAGTGSLGVARYVILVEGKGSPDGNYLLDLKQAMPSALAPHLQRLGIAQPAWPDEARRVVTVQKRMQAVEHAFLHAVAFDGQPFILKGLQPSEDRVAMGDWGRKLERLREVAAILGRTLAWDQLRAAGRGGAASADELIAFAGGEAWLADVLDAAEAMTGITRRQWQEFCAATP